MRIILIISLVCMLSACMSGNSVRSTSASSALSAPAVIPAVHRSTAVAERAYPPLPSGAVENSSAYKIGAADLLDIKVFRSPELSLTARVDARGGISMPLLGSVLAKGLTPEQLERRLEGMLRKDLLQNPKVTVFVVEYTAQRVTVEGEVNRPGVFPIKGNVTVLQAIAMAGGLGEFAVPDDVVLFRKAQGAVRGYSVNLSAIRQGMQNDPLVQNEDRLVVHKLEQRVTLAGEVIKPGVFPFKDRITLLQAIALGGGLRI